MIFFALTIFFGAFLLFQIQPMIGKFILPWFGGGPGVWTTCMLFFQVLLLGGYAYAHLISRWCQPRRQVIIHLALLGLSLSMLPVIPSDSWKPQGSGDPRLQILSLLAATVGVPYFALSATGPLIQHWFSRANPVASPYRLYALSNAGSLLALLSYPFYFETEFSRLAQAGMWGGGLLGFTVCCVACGTRVWKISNVPPASPHADVEGGEVRNERSPGQPSLLNVSLWLLLPACASVLLIAITNKLSQDVTVIPLLWVIPLALYLLSFIICFDSPRWYLRIPFAVALVISLAGICWVLSRDTVLSMSLQLGVYSVGLLVACMVCHGELYRLRPAPAQLTRFYLMIAAGGALGGIFVTLVAPILFSDYHELHWGLLLCGVLAMTAWLSGSDWGRFARWRWITSLGGVVGLVALAVALWIQAFSAGAEMVQRTRNFYGVLSVLRVDPSHSSSYGLKLAHGITTHGLQLLDPALKAVPTTYYSEESGVGRVLRSLSGESRRIGVIGLGVGTLAIYARTGDSLRLYEINPEVEHLARTHFSYLSECAGSIEVVLGDARLALERESSQQFDLFVMDAFSGDAIPMHLLTQEAFVLYEKHLKPNAVIAVHISNRHLNLEPVVANVAERFGYQTGVIRNETPIEKWWLMTSVWIVLCKDPSLFQGPLLKAVSVPARSQPSQVPLWTDDFASIYRILRPGTEGKKKDASVETHISEADALTQRGDYAGAIARYRSALGENPNALEPLNNLAWLLAAGPDAAVRDGAEAVRLSERACQLTEYRRTFLVGTLAAAYAEAGRFGDAVTTAEKACALASESGDEVLLSKNRQLLELYRNGKPYHEPPPPGRRQ